MISTLLSAQLLFSAVSAAAVYALVALGLNLVYGTMRLLNVAHGELVMVGGYAAYWAFSLAGAPPPLTALLVFGAAALFGVGLYRGLFAKLLAPGSQLSRIESNSLLLFFGISVILQNVAAMSFTGTPRGYEYMSNVIRVGEIGRASCRERVL